MKGPEINIIKDPQGFSQENVTNEKYERNTAKGKARRPPINQCDQVGIGTKGSGAGKKLKPIQNKKYGTKPKTQNARFREANNFIIFHANDLAFSFTQMPSNKKASPRQGCKFFIDPRNSAASGFGLDVSASAGLSLQSA